MAGQWQGRGTGGQTGEAGISREYLSTSESMAAGLRVLQVAGSTELSNLLTTDCVFNLLT